MTLNAGGPGYGSLSSPGFSHSGGATETAPLLTPGHEADTGQDWRPLNREQLELVAGGPGWRKLRLYLVLLFWLSFLAILATSVTILVMTPKPVARPLRWWQKTLFYQLHLEAKVEEPENRNALSEELSFLRSLGVGALILDGLFGTEVSLVNMSATTRGSSTLTEVLHVLQESNKADLKVVLDFCDMNLLGSQDRDMEGSNTSAKVTDTVHFWLAHGVAGFTICDTDEAYSEKTLMAWRIAMKEFSSEEERILLVKQKSDSLLPLNTSDSNSTLVDVVIKPILPMSSHLLSGNEVSSAIETHLYLAQRDGIWNSWMVGGKASDKLKKLLLVLLMTLPGSPAVEHDSDIDQKETSALSLAASFGEKRESGSQDTKKRRHLTHALFSSLSQSRAREEALLYGSFTFLPFHSSNTSNSTDPQPPPVLAFLRSWGCVHFLILLNISPETHALDPVWFSRLPEAGVFVASTGMDRLGTASLDTLELQPHEAIVIKLFEQGGYS